MKNNKVENLVVVKENHSEFTHTFKIPFKKGNNEYIVPMNFEDIFKTFHDVIVDAVQQRMNSCVAMLYRNIDRIISSDEFQITFQRNDGTIHSFNHPSYRTMEEIIEYMNNKMYEGIRKQHADQIIKALFWVEKPEKRNGISFGNLISMLMEIAVCSPML